MPDWAPTPDQVAALLRARTQAAATVQDPEGAETGSFGPHTRPTREQVEQLIAKACAEVGVRFAGRTPCRDDLREAAGVAAAYRAAQLVEVSYFPERNRGDDSAARAFGDLFKDAAVSVAEAVKELCPLDGDSNGDGGPLAPAGRVPKRTLIGPDGRVPW